MSRRGRDVQMKVRITEVARGRVAAECERTGENCSEVTERLIRERLPPAAGEAITGIATLPDGTLFTHTAPSQELFDLVMRRAWDDAVRRMRES